MKILILGYSISGKASYELLKDQHECFIYDKKKLNFENYYSYNKLKKDLPHFDLVIRSPGIKITSKVYQLVVQLSSKIISEIELGLEYIKDNFIIGVTGSNGKTTLVNMIYHLLKDKYRVHKLGNIGIPLTSQISNIRKDDIVILELSSFQLENTYSSCIDIGIITNISDNHFDHVFTKESYIASKLKLINLSNLTYLNCSSLIYQNRSNNIVIIDNLKEFTNSNLNKYNQVYWNIACDIALKLNISKSEIENSKFTFKMEHFRMENVGNYNNLIFINDSKSTSISSTNACLDVYNDKPRIIILGGLSKKEDFKKVNKQDNDIVISFGKDKLKIFSCIGDLYFNSLDEVINYIIKKYKNKTAYIIFSPGCASLDQYNSYIERGKHFNLLIKDLL